MTETSIVCFVNLCRLKHLHIPPDVMNQVCLYFFTASTYVGGLPEYARLWSVVDHTHELCLSHYNVGSALMIAIDKVSPYTGAVIHVGVVSAPSTPTTKGSSGPSAVNFGQDFRRVKCQRGVSCQKRACLC